MLAGIAGTLLIVFVFAIPVLINADRYRAKAIFYLEASTGKKVEIGRLALRDRKSTSPSPRNRSICWLSPACAARTLA